MSSNNNFLLKIHMENEENTTEIYLNKERRSFTFINDECISDLIIPEFKITSLNMILKNISDASGEDNYYAEYENDGEIVREYDHEKVDLLSNMITKIKIDDFIDYQKDIVINEYYVDNIVDAYDCVLPIEMKKILSYTTNGVVFNGDEIFYFMPHDDITSYEGLIKNFIPFMIHKGKSYIGYDYKEALYKEYLDEELIKESKTLEELLALEEIELIGEDEPKLEIIGEEEKEDFEIIDAIEKTTSETSLEESSEELEVIDNNETATVQEENESSDIELDMINAIEKEMHDAKEDLEAEMTRIEQEYEETIKNIDYQFERLNNGIVQKEKKQPYQYKEKAKEEPKAVDEFQQIKDEIRTEVRKSLDEIEKTNDFIDEIDNDIECVIKKARKIKAQKQETKVVISDEIGKEAEEILKKLNDEIAHIEKAKQKAKKEKIVISDEIVKEAEMNKVEENKEKITKEEIIVSDAAGKEDKTILAKLNTEISKLDDVKEEATEKNVISDEIGKEASTILIKLETELKEQERIREEERSAKEARRKEREAKEKQEKADILSLSELINNSIYNAFDNYKINFNDTQKLIVEHLPYYEFSNDFNVIQIPEIEYDKVTLLPNAEVNLGRIKLKVTKCSDENIELLVQSATSIISKDGNKIKKGDYLVLNPETEIALRLNKKSAMETWSLKMEKSTFEKELRNIDFKKIMNQITELESYQKLGNIEKYELEKSIMLFLKFVMDNKDNTALEELYKTINKKPGLYEEFITKYNNQNSLKNKDSLATYEDKKAYLTKLNYVNGLIDAKWLDYPRYIFNAHNYFEEDDFLEEFITELNASLTEKDFYNYLIQLFNEYEMFTNLDEIGKENLDKCILYLSRLYQYNPDLSEDNKYKIEKSFMTGATEEEMALLISKLCRRGIRDYSMFVEYNAVMREKYLMGELKYPIYSEYFEVEEIRNGGEYDEF